MRPETSGPRSIQSQNTACVNEWVCEYYNRNHANPPLLLANQKCISEKMGYKINQIFIERIVQHIVCTYCIPSSLWAKIAVKFSINSVGDHSL